MLTADDEVVACHDPVLEISTADLRGWAHERPAETLMQAHLRDERGGPSDEQLQRILPLEPHILVSDCPHQLRQR